MPKPEFIDFVNLAAGGVAEATVDISTAPIGVASRLKSSRDRCRERKVSVSRILARSIWGLQSCDGVPWLLMST